MLSLRRIRQTTTNTVTLSNTDDSKKGTPFIRLSDGRRRAYYYYTELQRVELLGHTVVRSCGACRRDDPIVCRTISTAFFAPAVGGCAAAIPSPHSHQSLSLFAGGRGR